MSRRGFERWLPGLSLAGLFVALAGWSWGKWSDPQIDFGNELYTAWQITEGRLLYAEMAYRNGPLSHYLNALGFALFGVSARTLVWCNLAVLAAIVAMTFRAVTATCGRLPGTLACWQWLYRQVAKRRYRYGRIDPCDSASCEVHIR